MKQLQRSLLVIGLASLSSSCMTMGHDMDEMGVPPLIDIGSSSAPFEAPTAENTSRKSGEVSYELEARPERIELADGHSASMWTYNGTMPGPTLDAHVGDRIRVHLTNSLPVPTTVHWHGMRLPADMDGVPGPQTTIAPGADFTYEFTALDAGTFWYHPHVSSEEQVERGLYGAIVVRDDAEPAATSEHVAVLDDVLLADDGELAGFSTSPMQAMVGRQGNVLLVNGHARPSLDVAPVGLHRFRFVDAATARYFRLSLGGRAFQVIGFGNGGLAVPRRVTELLLVPGARADVLVEAPTGGALKWETLSYDRGHGTGSAPTGHVFSATVRGDAADSVTVPDTFEPIEPLSAASRARTLRLGENMVMHSGPTFSINGKVFPDGEAFASSIGQIEDWKIVNDTSMDHPFHVHGFRFQVVAEGGRATMPSSFFDTINVPAQQTITLRIPLEANPGMWMFHCHILEHAERGMMGTLEVSAP